MSTLYDYYNSDLRPVLIEQERNRKKVFSNIRFNSIVALGVSIVLTPMVVLFLVREGFGYEESTIGMIILTILYIGAVWKSIIKNHTAEVKQSTLTKVFKFIDPNLRFCAHSTISGFELVASGFFEPSTTVDVSGEDFIVGSAYGLNFRCSEIHLPRVSSQFYNGEMERLIVRAQGFKGLFAVIDLPERIDSVIYIFPNNLTGRVNSLGAGGSRLERIKLEDPIFERYFNAYGTNQVQARMVLTTKLIDDITMLRQKMGSSIMLSIKNNKLYIAVASSKDLFEPNIYKSYLTPEHIREYLKELNIVMQLVEDVSGAFKQV